MRGWGRSRVPQLVGSVLGGMHLVPKVTLWRSVAG